LDFGGAGYRSLCLLHAKQALYHLSYTPVNNRKKEKIIGGSGAEASLNHCPSRAKTWRSRVSIPVPADCEPTALPSELHPLRDGKQNGVRTKMYSLQAMGFEPMPLSRLAPKASALTTRPNLQLLGSRRTLKYKKQSQGGLEPPTPRSEV
jgi:hypothetical protein